MRKLLVLAFKELKVTVRDVGALVSMLLSPLLLTLAIGAAFGTGGSAVLSDIPVLVLDRDGGTFAEELRAVFDQQMDEGLLLVTYVDDEAAAREQVEADEAAALVVIPEGMSQSILPLSGLVQEQMGLDVFDMSAGDIEGLTPEQQLQFGELYRQSQEAGGVPAVVSIYASPEYQISASVIRGIVQSVLERINMTVTGLNVIVSGMAESQAAGGAGDGLTPSAPLSLGLGQFEQMDTAALPISLEVVSPSGRGFSWLDYSATSMAVLFLMFGVTSGGRTLLAERRMGTLPRLLISPTRSLTILVGKMAGIILTGVLQVGVLWGATSLIGAYWGPPLAVAVAILCLVVAATGVGALLSAWSKTPGQAGAIGSAFTLVGAAASGSFFPRGNLPQWLQKVSFMTPNAWGIEIFGRLQSGDALSEILPLLAGLLGVTLLYYLIAAVGFRRDFQR